MTWRLLPLIIGGLAVSSQTATIPPAALLAGALALIGVTLASHGRLRPFTDAVAWAGILAGLASLTYTVSHPQSAALLGAGSAALIVGTHVPPRSLPRPRMAPL